MHLLLDWNLFIMCVSKLFAPYKCDDLRTQPLRNNFFIDNHIMRHGVQCMPYGVCNQKIDLFVEIELVIYQWNIDITSTADTNYSKFHSTTAAALYCVVRV